MINVAKPFLPPIDEYIDYVKGIYKRNWLTNNGPLVNELELKLKEYFDLNHLLYVTNGTVALQLAIKALELKGEIITTPFSYVATTSSIVWENCTPVFADIDLDTLNIDSSRIELLITERTSAIIATHVYGNPCDVETIDSIAKKHGLKVIYDGAHCFGTKYKGKSVFHYGDISALSFHATKLFHSIEGGAVVINDPNLTKKIAFMRNFGHNGPDDFAEIGINAKNSEFHAAMGLVNFKYVEDILGKLASLSDYYDKKLINLKVQRPVIGNDVTYNHAYYPIVFSSEEALLKAKTELEANWVYARRYFYPSLHALKYVSSGSLPVAESVSKRVLCLPLYYELSFEEIDFIARLLLRAQNN